MHPTRRVLVLSLLVFLTCIWSSTGTAEAKGGRPLTSYVAVMGPGLEHPWVEEAIGTAPKGYRGAGAELFLNLATRLGVTGEGAAAKLMSPPDRSQLGPRFDAWFFMSCTPNFSGCKKAIHEDLYPFAEPEGPVAYLSPGQERLFVQMFGRPFLFSGWFRVFEGLLVRTQLTGLGATSSPTASSAPASIDPASATPPITSPATRPGVPPMVVVSVVTVVIIFGACVAYVTRRRSPV